MFTEEESLMAHHYSGETPQEFEMSKAERISSVKEVAGLTEDGDINFEGVRRALHQDEHKEAGMRIEGMELAKKDNKYFDILETVHSANTSMKEQIQRQSNYGRSDFFSAVADLNEEGYIEVNGSIELTESGENALLGTYILMENHSR